MNILKVNITLFVDAGKLVFVGVTSDWGVTCKFNKIMNFDSISKLEMFHRKKLLQYEVTRIPKMMKYINV